MRYPDHDLPASVWGMRGVRRPAPGPTETIAFAPLGIHAGRTAPTADRVTYRPPSLGARVRSTDRR